MPDPTFPTTIPPETVAALERAEREATAALFAAAAPEIKRTLGLAHRRIEDGLWSISRRLDHIMFCRLFALGIEKPVRAAAIDEAIDAFEASGVKNWMIQIAPNTSPLPRLLVERGFSRHPRTWAKFLFEGNPAPARTELEVREIGAAHAAAFGAIAAAAFGLPPEAAPWCASIVRQPGFRTFMAFDGEEPVAGGTVYIEGNASWLGLGATAASHRGRGAQSAILAARIRASLDAGATLISTETGIPHQGEAGPSFKNIQRAGFRIVYERPNMRRA